MSAANRNPERQNFSDLVLVGLTWYRLALSQQASSLHLPASEERILPAITRRIPQWVRNNEEFNSLFVRS